MTIFGNIFFLSKTKIGAIVTAGMEIVHFVSVNNFQNDEDHIKCNQ